MRPVTVSSQLRAACESKIIETITKCQPKSTQPIPLPKLNFRQMGRRAGVCLFDHFTKAATVTINPDYFTNHYDDMLNDTVPHEVAHYVAQFIFGRRGAGHNLYWKMVMSWVGLPGADRCHEYSLEGVKTRKVEKPFKYSCDCGIDHWVTHHIHNKHQFGRTYRCGRCRKTLTYEGMMSNGIFIPKRPVSVGPAVVRTVVAETTLSVFNEVKTEKKPAFRIVTKFINGVLVNERIPVAA